MTTPNLTAELVAKAVELETLAADAERLETSAVFMPDTLRAIARLLRTAGDVVQVGHDHRPTPPAGAIAVNIAPQPPEASYRAGVDDGYAAGLRDGRRGR